MVGEESDLRAALRSGALGLVSAVRIFDVGQRVVDARIRGHDGGGDNESRLARFRDR